MIRWQHAWQEALYGLAGFYRQPGGPAGHFTTSTHGPSGQVMARTVLELAHREGAWQVVDLGCGRGELLAALHALEPQIALTGVDVVPRPGGLPDPIAWCTSPGGARLPAELADLDHALVIANEWLDVVPCPVAVVQDRALLELLVEPSTGEEAVGGPLCGADLQWCQRFWPSRSCENGERVEVGLPRDEAWAELLTRIRSGTAVAIDYGHLAGGRPSHGTLTGYRDGRQVPPVPDGTCDLTAHVAIDSLPQNERVTQREALQQLGIRATPVPHALARADPTAYLMALAQQSAEATLLRPNGLGDFWWVLSRVG